jgi:homoserine O-acetyltransferase
MSSSLPASPAFVTKRTFRLPAYTTEGGRGIKDVRVGYETWGRLNARGDNAIFVAHYYSGTSHAAGLYGADDAAPGYWDAIIGPGRAIDTERYFVVSADTLCNINAYDPRVVTTGPASIDPDTGKPYGMRFPTVTLGDSVRVHKALIDSLGITRLHAVAGASGGANQAMEWAVQYPELVERVVHVIGPGFSISPWVIALLDAWVLPIRMDARWNQGDYHEGALPVTGVAEALKTVLLTARHWDWAQNNFGYRLADPAKAPIDSFDHLFRIQEAFAQHGIAASKMVDGNHMIYMARANQLYNVEDRIDRIKARILFCPATTDLVFPPRFSLAAAEKFRGMGGVAQEFILQGDGGHLDGLFAIAQAAPVIRAFIES